MANLDHARWHILLLWHHTSPGYSGLLILMIAHQPPCINFFQHTPAVRQGCCVVWLDFLKLMWVAVADCCLFLKLKLSPIMVAVKHRHLQHACRVAWPLCQPNHCRWIHSWDSGSLGSSNQNHQSLAVSVFNPLTQSFNSLQSFRIVACDRCSSLGCMRQSLPTGWLVPSFDTPKKQ
jgi:hypothetical protein